MSNVKAFLSATVKDKSKNDIANCTILAELKIVAISLTAITSKCDRFANKEIRV